ncbi:MAG: DUF4428 domain-containing protein [Eggerthellaceae bacterium]|nr:DUF4428 domain-containing protein [Eggerthellaceae bacterium]
MGLFGGLFKKESCGVCGAEVGALKRKKIADGAICKGCAAKCSPWFDDFKGATTASIQEQIEYRERNKNELRSFELGRSYGDFGAVLISADGKRFCALGKSSEGFFSSPRQIASIDEVIDMNPDIIPVSDVESVDVDIRETRDEHKRTENGRQVSYSPRRYTYKYTFVVDIRTKHPYAKNIRVQLNNGTVNINHEGERMPWVFDSTRNLADMLSEVPGFEKQKEVLAGDSLGAKVVRGLTSMATADSYTMYGFNVTPSNRASVEKYGRYVDMANEIRAALEPTEA